MKTTKAELSKQIDSLEEEVRRLKRDVSHLQLDLTPLKYVDKSFDHTSKPTYHVREVVQRAHDEWELNVTEPGLGGDSSRINLYIKSREGIGWTWEADYTKNGQFAWCGAFAAFCYTKVQFNIKQKIFPSCYRMYSNWGGTSRKVAEVMKGDIVVVYTSSAKTPDYGNHITIALSSPDDEGNFETIEGNAKGEGPTGEWREGVIKRQRSIFDVAHIYRLNDGDYDE